MKKIAIIITIIGAVALSSAVSIGYMSERISFLNLGQEIKKESGISDSAVAFTIDGQAYQLKRYNTYKASMKYGDSPFTDQEIFDRYVKQKLLLQEAERMGISVQNDEIKALTQQKMESINGDPALKKQLDEYLKGADISLEEYIELSDEASKQQILYDKLMEKKKLELPAKTSASAPNEGEEFQKSIDSLADQLKKEADIKIVDNQLKETVRVK